MDFLFCLLHSIIKKIYIVFCIFSQFAKCKAWKIFYLLPFITVASFHELVIFICPLQTKSLFFYLVYTYETSFTYARYSINI